MAAFYQPFCTFESPLSGLLEAFLVAFHGVPQLSATLFLFQSLVASSSSSFVFPTAKAHASIPCFFFLPADFSAFFSVCNTCVATFRAFAAPFSSFSQLLVALAAFGRFHWLEALFRGFWQFPAAFSFLCLLVSKSCFQPLLAAFSSRGFLNMTLADFG